MLDCLGWIKNGDTDGIIKCNFGKDTRLPYQFISSRMSDVIVAFGYMYCCHCVFDVCLYLWHTHANKTQTNWLSIQQQKNFFKKKRERERDVGK